MTKAGVFIDDQDDQREVISRLLSKSGIDFSARIVPTRMKAVRSQILDLKPDIIVMDYRLDEVHGEEFDGDFRAGALAQNLREAFLEHPEQDAPIVLLSTEGNIRNLFQPDRTAHDLFDQWFLKDQIQDQKSGQYRRVFRHLNGLIEAYHEIKALRADLTGEDAVRRLLGLPADAFEQVETKGLKPLFVNSDGEVEATHLVARQILKRLILRPGILMDEATLRAKLGISEDDNESFERLSRSAGFEGFLYAGVFSGGWRRYWRHRFNRWIGETFDSPLSAFTGMQRVEQLNTLFDTDLKPAVSRWSGSTKEHFAAACRVCGFPTEIRYSVAEFNPRNTAYTDPGRICFDCVDLETEMSRKQIRVDESEEVTVRSIRDGTIIRPNGA